MTSLEGAPPAVERPAPFGQSACLRNAPSGGRAAGKIPVLVEPAAVKWTGDWKTDWHDPLQIQVLGNSVVGFFDPLLGDKGSLAGTLSADGKKITGVWQQQPFSGTVGGADAIGSGRGRFEFELRADGKGFTGK